MRYGRLPPRLEAWEDERPQEHAALGAGILWQVHRQMTGAGVLRSLPTLVQNSGQDNVWTIPPRQLWIDSHIQTHTRIHTDEETWKVMSVSSEDGSTSWSCTLQPIPVLFPLCPSVGHSWWCFLLPTVTTNKPLTSPTILSFPTTTRITAPSQQPNSSPSLYLSKP